MDKIVSYRTTEHTVYGTIALDIDEPTVTFSEDVIEKNFYILSLYFNKSGYYCKYNTLFD